MLGEYRLNLPKVIDYLLEGVRSLSIVSRFNSMSAISKIGNADALVKALIISSEHRRYMNMKVMTDILDNFEGKKKELDSRLVESFSIAKHELKLLMINYFYNEGSRAPVHILHNYLRVVRDKEEHIQLLKYFRAIKHPEALETIRESLSSEYWEVRAIAAKALSSYTDGFKLDEVIDHLSDQNWFVRTNIASAILEHLYTHLKQSDVEIEYILSKVTDKYALGALEYARHLHENPNTFKKSIQTVQNKE